MSYFDPVRRMHRLNQRTIQQASRLLLDQFNLGAFYYKKISNTGRLVVFESHPQLLDCIDAPDFVLNYPAMCHPKFHQTEIQMKNNSENPLLDDVENTRNILTDFNFYLGLRFVRHTTFGVEEFGFHSQTASSQQCQFLFNRLPQLQSFMKWFLSKNASAFQTLEEAALDLPKIIGPNFYKNRILEADPSYQKANQFYEELGISKEKLTSSDLDTLKLLIRGYTAVEIADSLHRSKRTIEHRIENLKLKWSCSSKRELIEKAQEIDHVGLLNYGF